jgi:NAD(P)-dependent dehydrogenase (short-subunit alcohol dehydrogenase family)
VNSDNADARVAIVSGMSGGFGAAALAAIIGAGGMVVRIGDDEHESRRLHLLDRLDGLSDRLGVMSMIGCDDSEPKRFGLQPRRDDVTHISTPKRLSRRRARRLRGKSRHP